MKKIKILILKTVTVRLKKKGFRSLIRKVTNLSSLTNLKIKLSSPSPSLKIWKSVKMKTIVSPNSSSDMETISLYRQMWSNMAVIISNNSKIRSRGSTIVSRMFKKISTLTGSENMLKSSKSHITKTQVIQSSSKSETI